MGWLLRWKRDGCKREEREYKTEYRMNKKLDELNNDPDILFITIYKDVTYGEQLSLFSPPGNRDLPF